MSSIWFFKTDYDFDNLYFELTTEATHVLNKPFTTTVLTKFIKGFPCFHSEDRVFKHHAVTDQFV